MNVGGKPRGIVLHFGDHPCVLNQTRVIEQQRSDQLLGMLDLLLPQIEPTGEIGITSLFIRQTRGVSAA